MPERNLDLIEYPERFVCPADGATLRWPDASCAECSRSYLLELLPSLDGQPTPFALYDFRPDLPYVARDRELVTAHWKVVSGLLAMEGDRLRSLGFEDLEASVRRVLDNGHPPPARLLYLQRTLRNIAEFLRTMHSRRATKKESGSDSRHSSFQGYSRAYELISTFAEPTWLGWHRGRLARMPVLFHHLSNMERLSAIFTEWGVRDALEFGVGSGINVLLLRRLCSVGADVRLSGFDYPVNRVLTACATMEHFGLDVSDLFVADGMRIPWADASVDVVYSHYVIEQLAGFERQALTEMLRVARKGVVLFETALYNPTLNQRLYMSHSGYSRDLPTVVREMSGVEIVKMENVTEDRFFGCPNVMFVLRKVGTAAG